MAHFADDKFIEDAIRQYSDTIIRIAFGYTQSKADAEDILQEVFISLIKQSPCPTGEYLKAWLIRIAINKSKDYLRASKRRKAAAAELAHNNMPEEFSEVFDGLQKLPEKDRDALYLYYYEGYTAKEIAGMFNQKEKAVAKRLGRAREKLKKFLEE